MKFNLQGANLNYKLMGHKKKSAFNAYSNYLSQNLL